MMTVAAAAQIAPCSSKMATKAVRLRSRWAASPATWPTSNNPAGSSNRLGRAHCALILARTCQRSGVSEGAGSVEEARDAAILDRQPVEKSGCRWCPIAVAIGDRRIPAHANLAGEQCQCLAIIDVVPLGQRRGREPNFAGTDKCLAIDLFRAPVDLLKQPPVKLLQSDQIIAAVGRRPEDDAITRLL